MVRRSMLSVLLALSCAAWTLPMTGCEQKSETEKAADKVNEAAKDAGDAANDAADDLTE